MSIRYKIATLFAVLVLLILIFMSVSIFWFSRSESRRNFQVRLSNRAFTIGRLFTAATDSNYAVLRQLNESKVALHNKTVLVFDETFRQEYFFADRPGDTLLLSQGQLNKTRQSGRYFFSQGNKQVVVIHFDRKGMKAFVAIAAQDLDAELYFDNLRKLLLLSLLLAMLLSYVAGILFARTLVRPINGIINEVNLISSNQLSQRIRINNNGDELSRLATTFNSLLDRLEDSFRIQRRFIANASHELSTPLTSISSQIEVALQKSRDPEEYREVMRSIHEDVLELQQLTRSLLDIAKTNSSEGIELTEVRLDEILLKVVADVQKQNPLFSVEVDFDISGDEERLLTTFGNPNLLYIAMKNIVENGCKYDDQHESEVLASFAEDRIIVTVKNRGDVIAEADIQNIFQPFFRSENVKQKPGFGLGLTLTRRILALHKGSIEVESDPERGTVFTISLPGVQGGS